MTPRPALHSRATTRSSVLSAREHVVDHRLAVEADRHAAAVADVAEDDGEVLGRVPFGAVGDGVRRAGRGRDRELGDAVDELLAALAIGDQVGDRDLLQAVLSRRRRRPRPALDRAVVVDEFGEHADRRQPGQPAEVDRRLGVTGAHQHAALARDQRKDVAGPDEIVGAGIGIGEGAHRVAALLGRDAGGEAVAEVDRDGEGGAERRVVVGDHRVEMQAARLVARSAARRRCRWCGGR